MSIILSFFIIAGVAWADSLPIDSVVIPSGEYESFFKENDKIEKIKIHDFLLDTSPVTHAQFLEFVKLHAQYRKSKVLKLFVDENYLRHWKKDLLSPRELKGWANRPVVHVSWYVARKYCEWRGGRLPTIAEWEYASDASSPQEQEKSLLWYAEPSSGGVPDSVRKGKANRFGLYDMNGLIWELVEDFTAVIVGNDSRSKGDRTQGFYCGAGSLAAKDSSQYATFMRFAFRSGMKANYTNANLGFRCAYDNRGDK